MYIICLQKKKKIWYAKKESGFFDTTKINVRRDSYEKNAI